MRIHYFLLVLLVGTVSAEVYKSVNEHGDVVYSDRAAKGSKKVTLPPLPSYAPQPQKISGKTATAKSQVVDYISFTILGPPHDSVVRNNLGDVEIRTRLQPALLTKQGHAIQYFLDGQASGELVQESSQKLGNLDRGEHRLSASVINANGTVLISTGEVLVHIKRTSKLHGDRVGTVTGNPGFITDNPNLVGDEDFEPYKIKDIVDNSADNTNDLDPEIAELPANPGFRNRNPNILSTNPNVISPNPGLINPPLPGEN